MPQGQLIKYTWADINLKVGDCFSGILGDMRELFNRSAFLHEENEVLRNENEILKAQIEILNTKRKGVKNDRRTK